MKKGIFLLAFTLLMCAKSMAWDPIPFQVSYDDNSQAGHSLPKTPMAQPSVYIEDYTLLFQTDHPEYVLYIKDEDDNVVYSTVVTSAQTQVVLPSTLSGDYQIELVMGYWHFTGWIVL